jgi:hypothetical protein
MPWTRRGWWVLLLIVLLGGISACGMGSAPTMVIEGPALLFFYTDP